MLFRSVASGEGRAVEAAKHAIHSPLLDANIDGATDAIVNISSGIDIALWEVTEAIEAIQAASSTEINIIYGTTINQDITDEVIVTVIAAGFDENRKVDFSEIGVAPLDVPEVEPVQTKKEKKLKKKNSKKSIEEPVVEEDDEASKTAIPSWLKSRFK